MITRHKVEGCLPPMCILSSDNWTLKIWRKKIDVKYICIRNMNDLKISTENVKLVIHRIYPIMHQRTNKLTRITINLASGLHTACMFSPSLYNEYESLLYFSNLTLCWTNKKIINTLKPKLLIPTL